MTTPRRPQRGRSSGFTIPLDEHEQQCPGCGHQNGVHSGGTRRTGADGLWAAAFDEIWRNAAGYCLQPVDPEGDVPPQPPDRRDGEPPVCACTARTRLRQGRRA